MKDLNIIITMAGLGSRFRNAGYPCPKYMIKAKGRSLFEWSLESLSGLNSYVIKYIFIVRKEDNAESFIREKVKRLGITNFEIVAIDFLTDGQATTCLLAEKYCDIDKKLLVYNIDTYVEKGELNYSIATHDGSIPCFIAEGDHWSFVKVDSLGNIREVKEKVRISKYCSIGAYYFSTFDLFKKLYTEYYAYNSITNNKEKYIAPLYDLMIRKGMQVKMVLINSDKVHVLGTPEELNEFEKVK